MSGIFNDFIVDHDISGWPLYQPWLLRCTVRMNAPCRVYELISGVYIDFNLVVLSEQDSVSASDVGAVDKFVSIEIFVVQVSF